MQYLLVHFNESLNSHIVSKIIKHVVLVVTSSLHYMIEMSASTRTKISEVDELRRRITRMNSLNHAVR